MSPEHWQKIDQSLEPEMAHILFMDLVGYSKLPAHDQVQRQQTLHQFVQQTKEFARAQQQQQLISLPTGDGMALVFFRDPVAPVQCALELAQSLRTHPELPLRMGVHSGLVYRVADIIIVDSGGARCLSLRMIARWNDNPYSSI